jgi:hypothetical protein
VERKWGLHFPPDYRLFLRCLHATDRPRTGALWSGGHHLVPATGPGVYHWKHDAAAIAAALEDVVGGLPFDVENNLLWPDEWGPRPAIRGDRERVVREQVAGAPRLAPIFAHRSLLLEPAVPGNPVLSIHQSDIIAYGGDLRSYLLTEFASLLPPGSSTPPGQTRPLNDVRFWLDFESCAGGRGWNAPSTATPSGGTPKPGRGRATYAPANTRTPRRPPRRGRARSSHDHPVDLINQDYSRPGGSSSSRGRRTCGSIRSSAAPMRA